MGRRHSCVQVRAVSKNNRVMGWLDMRRWAFRYTTLRQRSQYFPCIRGKTRFRHYSEDEEGSPICTLAGDTCPDSPSRLEVLSHSTHLLDTHSTFFLALFSIYFLSPTLSAPPGQRALRFLLPMVAGVSRTPRTVPHTGWMLYVVSQ